MCKCKLLNPGKDRDGYLQVNLCKDCKPKLFKVHRLVAMAFQDICGEYVNGLEVDHLDTNPSNNRAENLRWCTHKDNINNLLTLQHKSDSNKGENNPMYGKLGKDNPNSIPIIQYDLQGNFIAEHEGLRDVERKLGISYRSICNSLKGWSKTSGGYIWKYKNPTPQNKAI